MSQSTGLARVQYLTGTQRYDDRDRLTHFQFAATGGRHTDIGIARTLSQHRRGHENRDQCNGGYRPGR